jgi:antitoxin component HigA of HigAB toxin-antitoxin module
MQDIKDYEGLYAITKDGRVWSYPKNVNANRKGLWLKQNKNHKGYYCVTLTRDGSRKSFFVARLVAKSYIPNDEQLPQVNHIDGDKCNNNVDNLEWTTNQLNTRHAYKNGLRMVKTTESVMASIKVMNQIGISQREIGTRLGLNQSTVSRVLSGKTRAL